MANISSQLASQTISKNAIADLLHYLGRDKWERKYNSHQLIIETWAIGIWVKQLGIISYKDLAEFIRETTKLKASGLQVKRQSQSLFLVQGSQKFWYAVVQQNGHYICECPLYRCRHKRFRKEFPQLFNALNGKIFCHHTVAAYQFLKSKTDQIALEQEFKLHCNRKDLEADYYDSAWY